MEQVTEQQKASIKVIAAPSIQEFLSGCGDEGFDFGRFLDGLTRVELPDGSQWQHYGGDEKLTGGRWQNYEECQPYVDVIDRHAERRHLSEWYTEYDVPLMVCRADKFEPSRIFCECCGWLSPETDPEIVGEALNG